MYSISRSLSFYLSLPLSSLSHSLSPSFPVLLLKFSICAPSPSNHQPPSLSFFPPSLSPSLATRVEC